MHMNLRVIAATIAVAVATFLFSLVAPPLLSLVPTDTVHAQGQEDGPSIEIEFDQGYVVRDNEDLNFTLTFSGISGMTGLTYDVSVAHFGEPNVQECEGAGTGAGMALGSFPGDTATATGTIPSTCPPYLGYALIVKLFDSNDDELITVASPFKVSPFMKLVLPGDDKPISPAGLWSEEFGDYSVVRFHVVDSASNKVYMYDLGTEEHGFRKDYVTFEGTYDLAGTDSPWGITSNETTTWVTNDGSATTDEVFAYSNANRSDRITDDEFTLDSSNSAPRGAVDFTINPDLHLMYVVDNSANRVFNYRRDRDFGSSTSTFTHVPDQDYVLDAENTAPSGLWLTGWLMYVSDSHADKVFAYEMAHVDSSKKAVRMPEYDIDGLDRVGNTDPAGITSDWRFVYVLDSEDKAIYAYEYPDVPFEPVTIRGASEVTVPENSTTTDEKYYAMDPNATSGKKSSVGLFRTLTDDRIFKLEHLGSSDVNGLIRIYNDFELVFWDSHLDCSTDPDFEDPKDVDKDNEYELILTGGNRGFPHAYFPVTVTITDIEHESPCFPGASTTRYIPESAGFGYTINPSVRALQRDGDPNIYSLGGDDAAEFRITNNGYLQKSSTTTLDYETKRSYSVTVEVHDDKDDQGNPSSSTDDSIDVSVKVVKAPVISGATSTTFAENGTDDVSTFTATNGGGPPITWSLEGHDANDFTIASTTEGGTLRFVKPPDFERPAGRGGGNEYEITVVASDGYQQVGHNFIVTVTDVNDPPVFSDGSSTSRDVDEGTAAGEAVGAPITATDQDKNPADTLTYSLSGTDANSFDFSTSTGQILTKVALDFATKDTYSITVKVRDNRDDSGSPDSENDASIDVTINVRSVNARPVLTGTTTVDYQEDGSSPVATYTATDPEGQNIRWGLSGTNADAFNIPGGVLSFKSSPDFEETQTYSVTVEASDSNSTSTLGVTVNIVNIDEPPVVSGSTAVEFAENDTGEVARYEDNDPERGSIVWSLTGADADDMSISGGYLTFNSPPDHETQDTYRITVQASDGNSTSTLPVTINITDVNEDPAFPNTEDGQRSVVENTAANQPVGTPVKAEDPDDGDSLTYILTGSDADHFDIDSSTGQIRTKSTLNREERPTYSVNVEVHDGKDEDANPSTTTDSTIPVTITVTDVNEPPVVSGTSTTQYAENGTGVVATYTANDPENDNIDWSPGGTDGSAFTMSGGDLSFVTPPNYEAKDEYRVTVQAFDGTSTTTYPVTITITDVNEAPDISGDTSLTFIETASGPVETFEHNDPESNGITWALSGTDEDDFTLTDGVLRFASQPDVEIPADSDTNNLYVITIKATDDQSLSDTINVQVTVAGQNEPPTFPGATTSRDISETTPAGQSVGSPVTAADPERDSLTYSLSGTDAGHFDIATSTGQILTKSALDYEGNKKSYTVTVSVHDGRNPNGDNDTSEDATITVTINVTDENEAPTITGLETTDWPENATGTIAKYTANDPEMATTTWTIDGTDKADFSISDTGVLTIDNAPDYESGHTFYQVIVRASDGQYTAELDVTINITNVDEPGVVTLSPSSPVVGTQINAFLTDPDLVASTTRWSWHRSLVNDGSWSLISGATGSAYTPVDADEGKYLQATAYYTDGHGPNKNASGVTDIKVPITNGQPSFTLGTTRNVDENTGPGQPVGDPITAQNDEADDTLVYELGGPDADMFGFSTSTGQILTKEPLDFESGTSSYSVIVSVSDGKNANNGPDPAMDARIEVTINVRDVNEPPEISGNTTFDFDENATGTVATFEVSDPEINSISWSPSGADRNAFNIVDGVLTFKSPPDFEHKVIYNVTIVASDGPNSDTHAVTVNINNIDEDGSVSFSSDQPQRDTPLTASISDPDKGISVLGWTWVIGTTTVRTATSSTGTTDSYTPVEADVGKRIQVTVSYTDGQGPGKSASATSANSVRVPPVVNHAPTYSSNTAERSVPENTGAGEDIGSPVEASDQNVDDDLTYTLGGQDEASFDIDSSNGQLKTKAELNHERDDSYTVTVTASDPSNEEATVTVTIAVTDVDEPPDFTSGPTSVNYAETATGPVATYAAVDPEGEQVVWNKTGIDGSHFSVINGELTFNAQPDYDNPRDDDGDNEYHVVVVAQVQGSNATATRPVIVTVTPRNEPPQFPSGDTRVRSVAENTDSGQNVGAPVAASDSESDTLEYTLSGRDARSFDINSSTGQILTRAALNYESKRSYSVRVSVRDNMNVDGNNDTTIDDYIDITIEVINENEAPEITGAASTNFAENSTRAVASYRGRDPEGGTVTWTVLGTDSAYFAITDSGVLSFDPAPDYEDAKDSDRNNVYHVIVQASDGNNINRLDVTVTVTNVEEAGTVDLSSVQPQVDTALSATLDDPDEVTSTITWRWESSTSRSSGWRTITTATSDSYTPATGDVGRYLRVTASYTDGFNTRTKTARAISENSVRGVPTINNPPRYSGSQTTRTVEENAPAGTNVGGPVTAIDDANDRLTYRLGGTDVAMFSIGASTGQIQTRVPLDHESDSAYRVTVKAIDPSNASSTITVNISVTNVDEPPVTVDDVATTTEDGSAVTINVLANDSDPEGSQLTLTSVTQPSNGSAVMVGSNVEYTPTAGYYGSDSFTYTVSDGNLSSIGNVNVRVAADSDETVQVSDIPIQFVPIDDGGKRILLSDYFSDPDEGHPPYQATTSDTGIMRVEVSDGYLSITPVGIGVATTTLTVSDTPGISQQFRVVVYRPVVARTDTETVRIVDPDAETTLVSKNGVLSVLFQAGARDQFFQVAIDAQSNNCGVEAPIGHQQVCVLVDLFDLGAESIDENLSLPSTLHVTLDQSQFSAVQTAISNGQFQMWKGHGPTDVSWDQIQPCPDPVGTDECYELTADENGNGGTITVYNIAGFSEFAAGSDQPAPPPTEPPTTTPPPTTGGGGSGGGSGGSGSSGSGSGSGSGSTRTRSSSEYQGNQTPQIFGRTNVTYSENGTDPVAEFEAEDADGDEITWSLLGYDRSKFEISQEGVLSFRNPPDYEDPQGRDGNTYRVILQAEDDGRPSEYDVHNVRVTVTQVNELGELSGDAELSLPENSLDAITQYQVDDPEKGTITWTLSGPDAGMFQIDEQGNLSPAAALDFETPASSDDSNVHSLKVTATDNGEPELSVDMDVSITITNVNEAPLVDGIPGVELGSDHRPWLIDLGMYFTDPDGDDLGYDFSGDNITDVALAHLEEGTLSIDPVSGGEVSFYVVASDAGGLSAVTSISVSVTEPEPVPTPAPAVTVPVPVSTPAPAVTVPAPVSTPAPVIVAPEPVPTYAPLPPLVERRIRNQTQESDSVSKVIVAFAIEPVGEPIAEVSLPPVAEPPAPQKTSPVDEDADGHSPAPLSASLDDDGGGLTIWLWLMLVLVAGVTGGYAVRMYVIHRL